ncbi:MAG: HEAT repeat domain-containing protein [Phycisphaerales bacterium]|nr:HEAT repeat domain-containing protein [Phycisphaerales bacterium]
MLQDDRPEIRSFGVERIAVLLRDVRDGQETEAIEYAVVERLGDPEVDIRRQVAALLSELSNPNVVETVTARLEVESDPEVLRAALRYLQTRGDRASLARMLPLLGRDGTREAAAETMWLLLKDEPPSPEEQAELLESLGDGPADSSTPAMAALWVLAVPPEQLNQADSLLVHPDANTRTVVAEALLRRGRYDPLLQYGNDVALYQVALEAALEKPSEHHLDRINRLLRLPPSQESDQAAWSEAIAVAARTVPLDQQVALDEQLTRHPAVPGELRVTVLNQAVADEDLPLSIRMDILRRLVPLLLELNQAKTALAKLDAIPDDQLDEDMAEMRFQSALLARVFDAAAQVHDEPEPWIAFYEATRETHPDESESLRSEITRRFNNVLDPMMKARLGIAVDPTMPGAASANADDDGADGRPR